MNFKLKALLFNLFAFPGFGHVRYFNQSTRGYLMALLFLCSLSFFFYKSYQTSSEFMKNPEVIKRVQRAMSQSSGAQVKIITDISHEVYEEIKKAMPFATFLMLFLYLLPAIDILIFWQYLKEKEG